MMPRYMHVYVNNRLVAIESNLAFAVPFWEKRRALRERDHVRITWRFT